MKAFTLELTKTVCTTCRTSAVVTEVDYVMPGDIKEIRMWSEQFKTWVAVDMKWLEENFPKSLSDIKHRVDADAEVRRTFTKTDIKDLDQEIA